MTDYTKSKEAEYRENQIGTEFISCPGDEITRVFITGEIASAQNFPQTELFLSYRVTLPLGWKAQISEEFQSLDLSPQQLKELNCLDSITHTTMPVIQKNKDGGITTKFYFCFPLDFQFLVKSKVVEWPAIHFQVYSKDYWDRILMHGCGYALIPSKPGYHQITAQTWKPIVDLRTRVSQFFLGGLIRPKNIQDISKPQKINELDQSGPVNRFQYHTQSSGKVNLQLNVAIQSQKVKTDERVLYRDQKFSQQTEQKKKQIQQSLPSFVNTGSVLGGRFTNTKL